MTPETKPDYLLDLEKRVLGWGMGIVASLIIGFLSVLLMTIINFNRLDAREEAHDKANQARFQFLEQRQLSSEKEMLDHVSKQPPTKNGHVF